MQQLVKVTQGALASEEACSRDVHQRNRVSDSLRLLQEHGAALVKGYPMALLEIFAQGPAQARGGAVEASGMDFGELSLLDDNELQAQVELSKAQQSALHATDAVLAELNGLVSAAQGLHSVQPERNPLRPESYIRALQQVVGETGVPADVRQWWMQHMRDLLGRLLVEEYRRTIASLREHGVQPVGYAVLTGPSGGRGAAGAGQGTGQASSATGYASAYGTGYGSGYGSGYPGDGHSLRASMVSEAEEALLTVGILRQMLAGGDPFGPHAQGVRAAAPMQGAASPLAPDRSGWADARTSGGGMQSGQGIYGPSGAAAEAMEDMAQLERLVGRLASGRSPLAGSLRAPLSGWRAPAGVPPVLYATMPMEAALQSTPVAMQVVRRMMDNIAQDARLLPPVQQAVKALEPALQQLVQHDVGFFTDDAHPARRMLDALTLRGLAFTAETTPGFSSFMRLLQGAVDHLAAHEIKDAGPFESTLKALQSAWDTQDQSTQARHKTRLQAEQRDMLAEKIAADIRKLPDLEQVPADVLDFATGPWADVIALAQVLDEGRQDDPGGYLALVPVLLWSSQPALTRQEPERLTEAIPGLLARLRKGLKTIHYPGLQTSALLQRLVGLHQAAFENPAAPPAAAPGPEPEPLTEDPSGTRTAAPAAAPTDPAENAAAVVQAPDPYADFVVGAWVELVTNGRVVRTQLTWASPQGTLFLFTAPDASTQSMTRRMRDKLALEGLLRVVPSRPVAASGKPLPRTPAPPKAI